MSNPLAAAKLKAETAYNAAADNFDAEPLGFWARYGRRTVERLRLQHGAHVLDVGWRERRLCIAGGTGRRPRGPRDRGRSRGRTPNWDRPRPRRQSCGVWTSAMGDMTDWGFPDRHFDAVVCVFGIFFVPDMEHQVGELWRMARPGGQLAITTWGARFLSPADQVWLEAVRRVRPELSTAFNP